MAKRNLYLKTVSVETAYEMYYSELSKRGILKEYVEEVATTDSLGRVTSEAIYAKCNSPLFNAAAMDGICVESIKTKNANEESPVILKLGVDYKIVDTGDAIKNLQLESHQLVMKLLVQKIRQKKVILETQIHIW